MRKEKEKIKKWRVQVGGIDMEDGATFIEHYYIEAYDLEEAIMDAEDLFLEQMTALHYNMKVLEFYIDELDEDGNVIANIYEI